MAKRPNVIFVFADQMRAQAMAHAGDPNAITPTFDRFATEATRFDLAVSGCPVCCPARGSLITGQYPDRHGVFVNDVTLGHGATSIAQAFKAAGYRTGYIGKWHLYGQERGGFIPEEGRQGFDDWCVRQCTHQYWDAFYYGDTPEKKVWEGYDAFAQTEQACEYVRERAADGQPFLLMLSWGPPHDPYETAPEEYRAMFDAQELVLRGNVPVADEARVRQSLAGYYAHIAALDDAFGALLGQLALSGLDEDTVVVFWSDHGDMVGSHGQWNKQRPWDESIRVPLLIRWKGSASCAAAPAGQVLDAPINTPDLLPTLLGLVGLEAPATAQGQSYADYIRSGKNPPADAVLLSSYAAFGQYTEAVGGRAYRGVRDRRYTYVRTHEGPWLLYDNETDPYQMTNLVGQAEFATVQRSLEEKLRALLERYDDAFLTGCEMIEKWGYGPLVDEHGTVRYVN